MNSFLDDKHRNAGDHITSQGRDQEVPLQLFASKVCQGWGGAISLNLEKVSQVFDISSGSHPYCHRNSCTVAVAKGLKKSTVVFVVQALAPILLIPEI